MKGKFEKISSKYSKLDNPYDLIPIPNKGIIKKIFAYTGPGLLVAVGYMDPGNWATDIYGGSKFGYTLMSVILISNFIAMFLQYLSLKLGIVTGKDLAQSCRNNYPTAVNYMLWIFCEIAIIACDLAEVIGTAIALNLLFSIPILIGVTITIFDTLIVLFLTGRNFRYIEAIVASLMIIITASFLYNTIVSHPNMHMVFASLVPHKDIFLNKEMLFVAIGILGATVMPHNLYLHSSIVNTRKIDADTSVKKQVIKLFNIESCIFLSFAFLINSAILILAAASFYNQGIPINDLQEAYKLLSPTLGVSFASTLFAIALLAAGQNSTFTGTMAGQIVMEGFTNIRLPNWLRRLITRLIAVIPVFFTIIFIGENKITLLLVISQVILSLQLPFAVIPLVMFTNSKKSMGEFKNKKLTTVFATIVSFLIISLNFYLVYKFI